MRSLYWITTHGKGSVVKGLAVPARTAFDSVSEHDILQWRFSSVKVGWRSGSEKINFMCGSQTGSCIMDQFRLSSFIFVSWSESLQEGGCSDAVAIGP